MIWNFVISWNHASRRKTLCKYIFAFCFLILRNCWFLKWLSYCRYCTVSEFAFRVFEVLLLSHHQADRFAIPRLPGRQATFHHCKNIFYAKSEQERKTKALLRQDCPTKLHFNLSSHILFTAGTQLALQCCESFFLQQNYSQCLMTERCPGQILLNLFWNYSLG